MQKLAYRTIEPRAYDPLIHEGFIRQADFVKAVQESQGGLTDLEGVLIKKYRVPKLVLGKTLSTFFDCPYIPYDERTLADPQLPSNLSHDYLRKQHWLYREDFQLYRGRGCDTCNQTGLKGRVALHELLCGSEELRSLIQNHAKTMEMQGLAAKEGMVTLG